MDKTINKSAFQKPNANISELPVQHAEVHPHEFHSALAGAMNASDKVKNFVHLYEKPEYEGMKTFLSPDKASGYAVKPDGDVVSVFSTAKGRGDHIVQHAIKNGGKKLDAFDGYLPSFYGKHGFKEYKREPNWTPGGPDVVYMHLPSAAGKIAASEPMEMDMLLSQAAEKANYYKKNHLAKTQTMAKSESPMATGQFLYLAVDGDSAGKLIGRAVLANDEAALHDASNRINHGQDVIEHWAQSVGGVLISAGGDEGNVKIPAESADSIEQLRADYSFSIGLTLTVGVGRTLSEAGKALMVGKLRGKDQICQYDEQVEQEYAQAQQAANDGTATGEGKKLGEAYMKQNEVPMQESEESSHDDCPYCQAMVEDNFQDEDHCKYCHDLDSSAEHSCKYCDEYDQKNAQHDPNAEGHPDDCPYCQEMDAQSTDQSQPQAEDDGMGMFEEHAPQQDPNAQPPTDTPAEPEFDFNPHNDAAPEQATIEGIPAGDPENEVPDASDVLTQLDGQDSSMNSNVPRDEDYDENVPGDMGMSEDTAPEEEEDPNMTDVLQSGLDQHADGIQREKVINMVSEALEGFKACKPILERAQQQAPQLYSSSLAMLKAMIEMAKMLGLAPAQEQNPLDQNSQQQPTPAQKQGNPQPPQPAAQAVSPAGKMQGR